MFVVTWRHLVTLPQLASLHTEGKMSISVHHLTGVCVGLGGRSLNTHTHTHVIRVKAQLCSVAVLCWGAWASWSQRPYLGPGNHKLLFYRAHLKMSRGNVSTWHVILVTCHPSLLQTLFPETSSKTPSYLDNRTSFGAKKKGATEPWKNADES